MRTKYLSIICIAAVLFMAACGKSDADLTTAVNAALTTAGVTGVTATVSNGVATLTGEVADITVKAKAEAAAKTVDGVKSVTNNITTAPLPTPAPPPADPMLKGKVEASLKKAGCAGVAIAVKDGVVTATGTVPNDKYVECVQIIQQSGLGKMENQLEKGK